MLENDTTRSISRFKKGWFILGSRLILNLSAVMRIRLDGTEIIPQFGGTWLHAAIHYDDIDLIVRFLRRNAGGHELDRFGRSPLDYATFRGFDEAVWIICSFGGFHRLKQDAQTELITVASTRCHPSTTALLTKVRHPLHDAYKTDTVTVSISL